MAYLRLLQDYMTTEILKIPGMHLTGDPQSRLPGFCSFVVEGIEHSVHVVNRMNERGICISSGSACSAASREASHVRLALGWDKQLAGCSIRITPGPENTLEEAEQVVRALAGCCYA